jgi:hypothetical protein
MFNKTHIITRGQTPDITGGGLSARTDRCLIPTFNPSERHILVQVTAPTVRRGTNRAPANIAYVVDRSGSMSGRNKLALAKQAVTEAIARQDAEDGFAVQPRAAASVYGRRHRSRAGRRGLCRGSGRRVRVGVAVDCAGFARVDLR